MENMKAYEYWLLRLPGVGNATIHKLLGIYGTAYGVYRGCEKKDPGFEKLIGAERLGAVYGFTKEEDITASYEKLKRDEIYFVTENDEAYPERLRGIEKPPYAIFAKGRLPEDDKGAIAIIGARSCSEYGRYIAEEFGGYIASHGYNVISGMARGIDGIGQRGALAGGGSTYAILGNGVDICYPALNRTLYDSILTSGGLLSVFPPGTPPEKRHFPERNRIVAALSDIVLVIEARAKSGTSNTVEHAMKLGKDVYAVPGRITDRLSDGCNILLRQGAGIALSPEDIIKEAEIIRNRKFGTTVKGNDDKSRLIKTQTGKKELIDFVDFHPKSYSEIYKRYTRVNKGAVLEKVLQELIMLSLDGQIVQIGSGFFYKNAVK